MKKIISKRPLQVIQRILNNGEKVTLLQDPDGRIIPKKEALKVIQDLNVSYRSVDLKKSIDQHNEELRFLQAGFELGNIYYRFNHLVYSERKFRENLQRHWSFSCEWCGEKVSSKDDKTYFIIESYADISSGQRCCSEICIKLLWKESLKYWLKNNGFNTSFIFHVTNGE